MGDREWLHMCILLPVAAWMVIAIAGLLWVIACGVAAGKMEKEGIAFWRGFLACLLLSPLAGAAVILIARMTGPAGVFRGNRQPRLVPSQDTPSAEFLPQLFEILYFELSYSEAGSLPADSRICRAR